MSSEDQAKPKREFLAGLSIKEIVSLLSGNTSDDSSTSGQSSHRLSFFLHFRSRYYPKPGQLFISTYYFGFCLMFLLVVELITGLLLMLYYVPTPADAYGSILRIISEVPFGNLLRNLHRLSGELIIIFSVLHLVRIYLTGAYKGPRRMTWVTGAFMLITMLGLAFTGYLLPWDQLAYWAVTIGTSMAEAIPIIGPVVNLLLRGGIGIGADGLMRFYVLHIAILPFISVLIGGIHYYRISRLHGVKTTDAKKISSTAANKGEKQTDRVRFLPQVFLQEIFMICLLLLLLIGGTYFFYQAPLEIHADPSSTPWSAEAPWYFLWLQGLLKLGNKTLMGVFVPFIVLMLVVFFPFYANKFPFSMLRGKAVALGILIITSAAIMTLGYMGTSQYGLNLPNQVRIVNQYLPSDGKGEFHSIPFDQLQIGIYKSGSSPTENGSEGMKSVLNALTKSLEEERSEPHFSDPTAIVIIEEWQSDLKRITLRIQWINKTLEPTKQIKSSQQIVHVHKQSKTTEF